MQINVPQSNPIDPSGRFSREWLLFLLQMTSSVVNVQASPFLAKGDGVTDDYQAITSAWAAIKPTGGVLFFPPGNYYHNRPFLFDVDLSLPHQYKIDGYGATLLAGPNVTGFAILVYQSFNNFGVTFEGLQFNHRGNTTVAGCIQAQGADNIRVINCACENYDTKAGYAGIELGPYTPGDANTNSFWSRIDNWTMRQRSGGEGTNAAMGIRLFGAANATNITNCSLSYCTDAIRIETDGVAAALANGCVIEKNSFEACTNAVTINTAAPAAFTPLGLRIMANRVESLTTFVNFTGASVTDSGDPPFIGFNYLTPGSVTNHLVNPNNQVVYIDEPSISGPAPYNRYGGPADMHLIAEDAGHNVVVSNLSGNSSFAGAHLVLGTYHFWVDTGTGKFYIKNGAPANATDGTVVGTQS